jgi:hypothetical protein
MTRVDYLTRPLHAETAIFRKKKKAEINNRSPRSLIQEYTQNVPLT